MLLTTSASFLDGAGEQGHLAQGLERALGACVVTSQEFNH
jgi:hypothetical protein